MSEQYPPQPAENTTPQQSPSPQSISFEIPRFQHKDITQQLQAIFTPHGLPTLAIFGAIVAAFAWGSAVLIYFFSGITDLPLSAFELISFIGAALLSGKVIGSAEGPFGTAISVNVGYFVLSIALFIIVGVYFIARSRAAQDGSVADTLPTLVRSLAEGAILGVVFAAYGAFFSFTVPSSIASGSLSSSIFFAFVHTTLLVGITAFCARQKAWNVQWRPQWWLTIRRELVAAHIPLFVLMAAIIVIGGIVVAVQYGVSFGAVVFALLLLPNSVVILSVLSFFGRMDAGIPNELPTQFLPSNLRSFNESVHLSDLPTWGWVIIVCAFLSLLVSALFVGIRRPRANTFQWNRIWCLPAGALIFWFFAIYNFANVHTSTLLAISVSSGVKMTGAFQMAGAMLAVSVLAEFLPILLARTFPALLSLVCGAQVTQRWLNSAVAAPAFPASGANGQGDAVPVSFAVSSVEDVAHAAPQSEVTAQPEVAAQSDAAPQPEVADQPEVAAQPEVTALPPVPGTPMPAAAPSPVPDVPAAPSAPAPIQPMDPAQKKKIAIVLIILGVIAALGISAAVALKILNSSRTADAAVREYAQALTSGNADLANAMLDPGIRTEERLLLNNEVLKAATEKLSVADVAIQDESSENTVVQVTYSLDGEQFTAHYTAKPGPNEYGVLHTWKLSGEPLKTISVHSPSFSTITVNGTNVDVPKDTHHVELAVYPGIYTITAPEAQYLTASTNQMVVGPDGSDSHTALEVKPTPALNDLILQKANEFVASCGSISGNMNPECPFAVRNRNLDKLEVARPVSTVELDEFLSFTTDKAAITIRQKPGFFLSNPKDELIEFTIRGRVELDDPENPTISILSGW